MVSASSNRASVFSGSNNGVVGTTVAEAGLVSKSLSPPAPSTPVRSPASVPAMVVKVATAVFCRGTPTVAPASTMTS